MRKYLTESEVEGLMKAARGVGRHGFRDSTMILLCFRHGLRCSELVGVRRSQFDLKLGRFHVARAKGSVDSVHPLSGAEIRAIRRLYRQYGRSPFLFVSERGGHVTESAFRLIVARAGKLAGLEFRAHPHSLRHACGYKLANEGRDTRSIQAYLGHRNIQHTVGYTELAAGRFDGFMED